MEAPGTKVIDHHFQTSMENCACNRAEALPRKKIMRTDE